MKRLTWGPGAAVAAIALVLASGRPAVAACPVTVADADLNGTMDLKILGTSGPQLITIGDDGSGLTVSLDCNGDGDLADPASGDLDAVVYPGIETINLQLGGKDTITYNQTAPWTGVARNLVLYLGPLTNTVSFVGAGGITGASLVIDLQGGPNVDDVTLDLSGATLTGSAVVLYAELSTGSDTLTVRQGSATASRVDVESGLHLGNNFVNVETSGTLVDSTLRVDVEGGENALYTRDTVSSRIGGDWSGSRYLMAAHMRGGDDVLNSGFAVGSLALDAGSELRVRGNGGIGNDFLSVNDANDAGAALNDGLIEAVLRGGPNRDVVDLTWNGISGAGTLRGRLHGGINPDVVAGSVLTGPAPAGNLDLLVQGGRANDLVFSAVIDPSGTASFGPGGAAILDGGLENDTCILFGDGSSESLNCEPGF